MNDFRSTSVLTLLRSTPALVAVLVGPLVARDLPSQARAADPQVTADAMAMAAIKKLGGSVRRIPGGQVPGDSTVREVDFHLRGRKLTDQGLVHVAALKDVVSLNLRDTRITGAGLAHLQGLTKLRWLHLERTRVGDDGIENLAGLVNLEYLNLYKTKITDKALGHLTKLKKLKRLYVWQTGVTDAGTERLEKALPKLQVVRGVDLSKFLALKDLELDAPKPTEILEWLVVSDASDVPRSQSGLNTQVYFENKSDRLVKLYWISYGGELTLYAELRAGTTRQQNSYARNTWLVTDENDRPLGYFIIGTEVSRAVIPKKKQ